MDTVVLKFGGSSVADNMKLNIVAQKIIDLYNKNYNVVVVVSAQGKTTDRLLKEAYEISKIPNNRELDVLLSSGEQISISKLSILLNELGYKAISLTGWQAGIYTNNTNQNAIISSIDTNRILKELEQRKIVIIAGFQGYNENLDITTLGRGGSDTTAVAVAAALKAKKCYIFSDVDGVYTTDPNKVLDAKKIELLSYNEMLNIANEGAKVLHNRCIEIAEKYSLPIITKSTFNNNAGSVITNKIEEDSLKSIVKSDDLFLINLKGGLYSLEIFNKVYNLLISNNILPIELINNSSKEFNISFIVKAINFNSIQKLFENDFSNLELSFKNISRFAIIGNGIANNNIIIEKIMKIVNKFGYDIFSINITNTKIIITFKENAIDDLLEELHSELF